MKKINLEQEEKKRQRFSFITAVCIAVTVVLAFLQLILSNHLASFGGKLMELEKEEKELTFENTLLTKDIATRSSLAAISQKAQTLSFVLPTQFLVISQEEPVALAQ